MNQPQINRVYSFPIPHFEALKRASQREGFHFLCRLEKEWLSEENTYARKGEGLYTVLYNDTLIAIGGITIDPYSNAREIGRLRRFYVKKSMRRKGIGEKLLNYLLTHSSNYFREVTLFTDNEHASQFYMNLGFRKVNEHPKISHRKRINDNFTHTNR